MNFDQDIVSVKNKDLSPDVNEITEDVQVTSANHDIKPANKEDVLNG